MLVQISDVKQLIKMFHAGGGTFFFLNLITKQKFCLKFKRSWLAKSLQWSEVHVCFNDGLYFHLGRFNFKYNILQLSDETIGYNYERLKLFIESFNWVKDRLIAGNPLPCTFAIFYDGTCCRCGKPLHHPNRLQKGIGEECEWLLSQENKALQLQIPLKS